MNFFKNFWIRFTGLVLLLLIVAGGVWYLQTLTKKPEFHPIKMDLSSDEKTAFIVESEGLGIFDSAKNKLSLIPASFGPNADIIVSKADRKIYIADRPSDKIFVYKDGAMLKEISVGSRPRFIFLNNQTQKLFVFNRISQDLNIMDTQSYETIATVKIGSNVLGGVLDEKSNNLYLMAEDGRLVVISGSSLKINKTINVGAFPGDYDKTPFDEIAQKMYFISKSDGRLWVIDTASGKVIDNKQVPLGSEVMTINSFKTKLYMANSNEHAVFVFDTDNLNVEKISLSPLLYPEMALADEEGDRLYVYSRSRVNEITVLDMKGKAIKSIPLGYPLSNFQFSNKTRTLYALSRAGGFMLTIKNGEEKFLYKKPEIVETKLGWINFLSIGATSKRLFALSDFSNNYLAFNRESLELIDQFDLGGGPYIHTYVGPPYKTFIINKGINEIWRIDVTNDGKMSIGKKIKVEKDIISGIGLNVFKKLYITSDDAITVVDGEKDEIVKTVNIKGTPKIVGADQEKNKIFVNIDGNSLAVIDGNSDTVENSLKIDIGKTWFDKTNFRIYVLDPDNKSLSAINSANLKAVGQASLDDSYNEMAAAPWVKKLYLLNSGKNKLSVLNGSLKKITIIDINGSLESAPVPQATTIYPDEKTNKIFLAHRYGQITVIDAASDKILDTIKLPYAANPTSLKTDSDSNRLYVANKWLNQIQIYDLKDYTLMAEIDAYGKTTWLAPQ